MKLLTGKLVSAVFGQKIKDKFPGSQRGESVSNSLRTRFNTFCPVQQLLTSLSLHRQPFAELMCIEHGFDTFNDQSIVYTPPLPLCIFAPTLLPGQYCRQSKSAKTLIQSSCSSNTKENLYKDSASVVVLVTFTSCSY